MNSLVFVYFICINLTTFVMRGRDKLKSVNQGRRVSENMLLGCSLLGGCIGGILGMRLFRHKTIKGSFQTKFFLICGLRIILLLFLLYIQ